MSITSMRTGRPVAGMPMKSPRCVPRKALRVTTLVALRNLIHHLDAEVGEGVVEGGEELAHALGARRDARQPAVVDDVLGEQLGEGVEVAPDLEPVDEAADERLVARLVVDGGLHAGTSLCVVVAWSVAVRRRARMGRPTSLRGAQRSRSCCMAKSAAAARLDTPMRA
jgi:hypothetical protein